MGDLEPSVTAGEVEVRHRHRAPHLELAGRRRGVELRHRGGADPRRRRVAGRLGPGTHRAEPERGGDPRHPGRRRARRDPRRRRHEAGHRAGRGPLRHRPVAGPGEAGRPGRPQLAALVDIDAAAYAKRVVAAGEQAFVEAIVYRRGEVPDALAAYDAIPGTRAGRRGAARPHPGVRGPDPRHRRRGDRGDGRGGPGDVPARRPGGTVRAPGQVRRLQGTDGAVVDAVGSDGKERELFRVDPCAGSR